jgi:hypothetical protein
VSFAAGMLCAGFESGQKQASRAERRNTRLVRFFCLKSSCRKIPWRRSRVSITADGCTEGRKMKRHRQMEKWRPQFFCPRFFCLTDARRTTTHTKTSLTGKLQTGRSHNCLLRPECFRAVFN